MQPKFTFSPALLVGFLALLLAVLFSYYYFLQIGDDSYIYFRYVDQALAGQFANWSGDGSTKVEGYSSPLWLALLIVGQSLGLPALATAKVLGLLSVVGLFASVWMLASKLGLSSLAKAWVLLLLACHAGLHYWSTSGLETPLYSFLFVLAVLSMVVQKHYFWPLALLGLARPEGPFLLLALVLAMAWHYRGKIQVGRLCLALLPTLLYLAWRYHYFGLWLPNTFYAKASSGSVSQLANGLFYSAPLLLPLLVLWIGGYWQKPERQLKIIFGAVAILLAIIIAGGGDWMFYQRLLQPLVPLLFLLFVYYVRQSKWWLKSFILLSLLPMLLFSVPLPDVANALVFKTLPKQRFQEGEMTHASIALAKRLAQQLPKGSLLAVNHAGALPYAMAGYRFIDMVGLNDPHIAMAKGELHQKFDVDYVLAKKPDAIVLNTRVKPGSDGQYYHLGYWAGEDALVQKTEFQKHYRPMGLTAYWQWQLPFPYHYFASFENNWIVVYQRIANNASDN